MVKRWDIITIGNVSRNRYWGEGDEQPVRAALCTSTLLRGEGFLLLVDPPIGNAGAMTAELDRRAGLALADVTHVFLTHEHGDHLAGLANFPQASWHAAPDVASAINERGQFDRSIAPTAGQLCDGVEIIPTPGHTLSHHSLRFECDGRTVVVAGDAVMTRDFWANRQGFLNSVDFELAAKTIDRLAGLADVIVPGHDNCFLVR